MTFSKDRIQLSLRSLFAIVTIFSIGIYINSLNTEHVTWLTLKDLHNGPSGDAVIGSDIHSKFQVINQQLMLRKDSSNPYRQTEGFLYKGKEYLFPQELSDGNLYQIYLVIPEQESKPRWIAIYRD